MSATIHAMDQAPAPSPQRSLTRTIGVVLVAFLAAVIVTWGAIQIRKMSDQPRGNDAATARPSDAEKLRILASLSSTSTPSIEDRLKILESLRTP